MLKVIFGWYDLWHPCYWFRLRARAALSWTKKKRSLRYEKLRVNKNRGKKGWGLRITPENENRKPRCPLSKDWSEVKLKRNLRLEKVVSSKQLRLAVATDRRRKKNKTGSFSEKLATMLIIETWCSNNIDTHNWKKYRSWYIVCFSHSSCYNLYIII